MKTQISQAIRSTASRYSGVYQQQGRMITDADWNEMSSLIEQKLAGALQDIIGSGTPDAGGAVTGAATKSLAWGTLYVDGVAARLRPRNGDDASAFAYAAQADYPDPPALPAAPYMLYVDVWERAVNALEDASLRDPALFGADTTTRTETMAQVKWAPAGFDAEDVASNPPVGGARLSAALRAGVAERDPCDPCADEIALADDVGNYLFRVEVHDVGYAADGTPERVVLKWSRENGAEIAYVGAEPPGFIADRWAYEFHHGADQDAASEKLIGYFPPAAFAGWAPARGELTTGYPAAPPADFTLVRRWDGFCVLLKAGANWTLAVEGGAALGSDRGVTLATANAVDAHGHVSEGASVGLSLDTVILTLDLGDAAVLAGDYWSALVRASVHGAGDAIALNALPDGVRHHYMNLASVAADGTFTWLNEDACKRFQFPRLTDLRAEDVCFDALSCEMPGVTNVQQAIDRLCHERDLKWHNQHLHGWGIVCGLIVECGADTQPEGEGDVEPLRRQIVVTPGYALAPDGADIVLEAALTRDLLELVSEHDATAARPILVNGDGSACLVLDRDANGAATIRVERYDASNAPFSDALKGTLLLDFWQHCVVELIDAVKEELSFLDLGDIAAAESPASVSTARRKLTTVVNLLVQLFEHANGSYVFLSHDEHRILAELYLSLRTLLQSRTFCAMFEGDEFPAYPFPASGMATIIGKGTHSRSVLHPDQKRLYTYGGPGRSIHVYDVEKRELVGVVDVPTATGAEVTALGFSRDGSVLYVAAQIRGKDSLYGRCEVNADGSHRFERMTVLCDVLVSELAVDLDNDDVVYAIGVGRGLFRLHNELLNDDQAESTVEPLYAFFASGQARFDLRARMAYAMARSVAAMVVPHYDRFVTLDLSAAGGVNRPPTNTYVMRNPAGVALAGSDDFDVRPTAGERAFRLFVVVGQATKQLVTFAVDGSALVQVASTPIQATQVRVHAYPRADSVLLAMEDGYRVEVLSANNESLVRAFRLPVQVMPQHISVARDGTLYVTNLILGFTNTISIVPASELLPDDAFLATLATYRNAVLAVFYGMFGHVLQYLKDCFCHHLLVKCPEVKEEDRIYLACVHLRESQIHNICNFSKRKYVKSFPTVDYWMSLVPVLPMLREAIAQACCSVLPDLFAKNKGKVIKNVPPIEAEPSTSFVSGNQVRMASYGYQRTDVRAVQRQETKNLGVVSGLWRDNAMQRVLGSSTLLGGVAKTALVGTEVEAARAEMARSGVEVAEVRTYDAAASAEYLQSYSGTPPRVAPGSKVTLYERDGKVAFYAVERSASFALDPATAEQLGALEARKAALADLGGMSQGLEALQLQKNAAVAEVTALQRQVESLRELRTAEEARFSALAAQRDTLTQGMAQLGESMKQLSDQHATLRLEIARDRPVTEVAGVTTAVNEALRGAGIRTVGELAAADAAQLRVLERAQPGLDVRTLIDSARGRIR